MSTEITGQQKFNRQKFSTIYAPMINDFPNTGNAENDAMLIFHTCVTKKDDDTVNSRTQAAFKGDSQALTNGLIEMANNIPTFKQALFDAFSYVMLNKGGQLSDPALDALKKTFPDARIGVVLPMNPDKK